jgi:hypothetical protein
LEEDTERDMVEDGALQHHAVAARDQSHYVDGAGDDQMLEGVRCCCARLVMGEADLVVGTEGRSAHSKTLELAVVEAQIAVVTAEAAAVPLSLLLVLYTIFLLPVALLAQIRIWTRTRRISI